MDLDRIHAHRFGDADRGIRKMAWQELAGSPRLRPYTAAGMCECLNPSPAKVKWGGTRNKPFMHAHASECVRRDIGGTRTVELPGESFGSHSVSNFRKHLNNLQEVAGILPKPHVPRRHKGRIAVMGRDFKCIPGMPWAWRSFGKQVLLIARK